MFKYFKNVTFYFSFFIFAWHMALYNITTFTGVQYDRTMVNSFSLDSNGIILFANRDVSLIDRYSIALQDSTLREDRVSNRRSLSMYVFLAGFQSKW